MRQRLLCLGYDHQRRSQRQHLRKEIVYLADLVEVTHTIRMLNLSLVQKRSNNTWTSQYWVYNVLVRSHQSILRLNQTNTSAFQRLTYAWICNSFASSVSRKRSLAASQMNTHYFYSLNILNKKYLVNKVVYNLQWRDMPVKPTLNLIRPTSAFTVSTFGTGSCTLPTQVGHTSVAVKFALQPRSHSSIMHNHTQLHNARIGTKWTNNTLITILT